jgi:hypothetical protein
MNRKIAFTALSLAIVLGGASGALAAGKKHSGHEAYASAGGTVADPRINKGSNHEGWCDMDAKCNGWAAWLQEVSEGKASAGH